MSTAAQTIMPFGKFKGKPVAEIQPSYLRWLAENVELRGTLALAVKAALGVGSSTPGAGKPVLASHTRSGATLKGAQGVFAGHDAPKPKPRGWIPRQEDLSAYYTPQGADDIPW